MSVGRAKALVIKLAGCAAEDHQEGQLPRDLRWTAAHAAFHWRLTRSRNVLKSLGQVGHLPLSNLCEFDWPDTLPGCWMTTGAYVWLPTSKALNESAPPSA